LTVSEVPFGIKNKGTSIHHFTGSGEGNINTSLYMSAQYKVICLSY